MLRLGVAATFCALVLGVSTATAAPVRDWKAKAVLTHYWRGFVPRVWGCHRAGSVTKCRDSIRLHLCWRDNGQRYCTPFRLVSTDSVLRSRGHYYVRLGSGRARVTT